MRQKEGLSYGINSSMQASSWEPNTTISISAIFAPENLERLRRAVQDEVERAQLEGFGVEEVADGKRALLQQRHLARSQDSRSIRPRPHSVSDAASTTRPSSMPRSGASRPRGQRGAAQT